MMKNPKNLLVFAFLGGVVGVGLGFGLGRFSASPYSKSETLDAASEMISVMTAQQDAWNRGDIDAFMDGYIQGEDLRFASGGDITTGWNSTISRYKGRYSDRAAMGTLRFDIIDVTVIDEDDGLIFGKWALSRENDTPNGLFTLHLKKGDNGWKVVSDHTSSADK